MHDKPKGPSRVKLSYTTVCIFEKRKAIQEVFIFSCLYSLDSCAFVRLHNILHGKTQNC